MGKEDLFSARRPSAVALALLATWCGSAVFARELSFEARVDAQEAIERDYYAHQVGAKRPFEAAVSRALLEHKVRTYLAQSAALESFWKTSLTEEALRHELARMVRGTREPGRLRTLFAALGDDPVLIEECLARPALAGRLARDFFAGDERFQGGARQEGVRLRAALLAREIDPWSEDPRRTVVELVRGSPGAGALDALALSAGEYARARARLPKHVGEIGPARESRERLTVSVVLDEQPDRVRVARYTIEKKRYDAWWSEIERGFDIAGVAAVESGPDPIPGFVESLRQKAEPLRGGVPCVGDDTWDNGVLDDDPFPLDLPLSVWTGSEMLVWGGGRYDPLTDSWGPISKVNAPPRGVFGTAIWTGTEMIVWGGKSDTYDIPGEGGRYNPLTDTWTPTSTAGAPSARYDHVAVWTGTEMILWGGYDGGLLGDGARYDPDGDSWSPVSMSGAPSPRGRPTGVWTGSVLVVWGGIGQGMALDTGGRYDPRSDTWTPTSIAGAPAPRAYHTAVWTGSAIVVWGGTSDGEIPLDSGALYDPATDVWLGPTSTINAPSARVLHSTVWTGGRMIVWGGSVDTDEPPLDTGGSYDPLTDTWLPTPTAGAPAKSAHTAVWTGELMVVWGGDETGARYDPQTGVWTPTHVTNAPSARYEHSSVWTGNEMIVWGGWYYQDTGGRYDLLTDSWTPTSTVNAPSGRIGHRAVWTGERMIVWGGTGPPTWEQDTGGRYDPLSDSWTPTSTLHAPKARYRHAAVWTGNLMLVWGGFGTSGKLDTGGRYDPSTDTWLAPITTTGAPAARSYVEAIWAGSRMIVWGGGGVNTPLATGGRYDPVANAWAATAALGAPAPRSGHTLVWTGSHMIVWGGTGSGIVPLASGGLYDPLTDTWSPTSLLGAPAARAGHSAVWTGSSMVVWGGTNWDPLNSPVYETFDSGGRYDPVANTWLPTSTVGAALARTEHTAEWTGSLMLVWAGQFDTLDGGDAIGGGRYALGQEIDDDGDGLSECAGDCNDVDAGALAVPVEITCLVFASDKETLEWESAAPAAGPDTVHDLVRGLLGQEPGEAREDCVASDSAATAVDPDEPASGEGFWYLVRGRNVCGSGTYGYHSDGTENSTTTCP